MADARKIKIEVAREVAELLTRLDSIRDWKANFRDHAETPFIEFGAISTQEQADGYGTMQGWDGELILPRQMAVEMMQWAEDLVTARLEKLNIEVPKE